MKRIAKPGRLQLNKSTLRRLTNRDLDEVAGGVLKRTSDCTYVETCSNSCTCTYTCYTYGGCPGGAM